MRICILEFDRPPPEHVKTHGDYGDMFEDWIGSEVPGAQFSRRRVDLGDKLPSAGTFDGYLLSGCRHGVYDDIPWKPAVQRFLKEARAESRPLGGVCFGHQIMAATFGAEVRKSEKGWVVGTEHYGPNAAYAVHQDQVMTLPDVAKSSSGTKRCAIGRIDYAFPAISVQYHPEFTPEYFEAFLLSWRGAPLPEPLVDAALSNLNGAIHRREVARDFVRVFDTIPQTNTPRT